MKTKQYYRGRQDAEVLTSTLLLIKSGFGQFTSFLRASVSFLQNEGIKPDFWDFPSSHNLLFFCSSRTHILVEDTGKKTDDYKIGKIQNVREINKKYRQYGFRKLGATLFTILRIKLVGSVGEASNC